MSLFPAYSAPNAGEVQTKDDDTAGTSSEWLENNSFPLREEQIKNVHKSTTALDTENESSENEPGTRPSAATKDDNQIVKRQKHKKKSKKRKREADEQQQLALSIPIDFTGDEEYYIDKRSAREYKTIRTLHKPACPRYRCRYICKLGLNFWGECAKSRKLVKRYFRTEKGKTDEASREPLNENDYTLRLGQLNRNTADSPGELQIWLDLIELHERNPYKWSRLLLAEKKLELLERALVYHARNETLYRMYIEIVNATYPSFEVTKILDRLISKDPYNYILWTSKIMTTQGSMARCIVPDVLHIYERCMQKMHHAQRHADTISGGTTNAASAYSDDVMLKLFNNCSLFLRQAGLYEQFFALLKLALELNVSTDQFGDFAPLESDQRTLIEYEELILQSGLPMNEIWLRIEKLRQGFNFLPCPTNVKCSDPQRVVFNEDVCHYIYPLKSRQNSFYLMLLILRLLKLPFVQCDGLARKFSAQVEHFGDSDAIEDILAVCIKRTFVMPQQEQDAFMESLYELSKEMSVSPSFLSSNIGHELYTRCIAEMLMNCAAAYAGIDERKRIVFLILWCRFECLLMLLQKCSNKLNAEYVKSGRSRFKALLKQKPNRNILNLYTEFAIYEYEALQQTDSFESIVSIFENLIAANAADETLSSDLLHTYVTYAEIHIGRGSYEQALQVLASYAMSIPIKAKASVSTTAKLVALQKISEKLESVISIECNVEIMVLEQYLLPDYTVSLLKMYILMLYLIGQKLEAMSYLDKLLNTFRRDSDRHSYLRENIQELYIIILQMPSSNCVISNLLTSEKVFGALKEFPRNFFILQRCCMLTSVPWYKIRIAMLRSNPSVQSVAFLIVLARYRFLQSRVVSNLLTETTEAVTEWDNKYHGIIVRNRILNIFQTLTSTANEEAAAAGEQKYNALQRNALFWRLYLRCLSDQCTAFETSKKCLLTALDECPWSKALYLDGATYVPQELSHLQDLLIEKQLRIYALPEELEILREQ